MANSFIVLTNSYVKRKVKLLIDASTSRNLTGKDLSDLTLSASEPSEQPSWPGVGRQREAPCIITVGSPYTWTADVKLMPFPLNDHSKKSIEQHFQKKGDFVWSESFFPNILRTSGNKYDLRQAAIGLRAVGTEPAIEPLRAMLM